MPPTLLSCFQAWATIQLAAAAPALNLVARQSATEPLPLAQDLISLSIEFGNTVDFFGDIGQPNQFSRQLLQNVADRSSYPPILRIGGNTQDRANFCEECSETLTAVLNTDPNDPKGSEALSLTYNENFYAILTENVPAGSPVIFGLNFRNNSYELAQTEIDGAFEYLDQSVVMAYELGNEVNLYGSFRPSDYDVQAYANQMQEWLPQLAARSTSDPKFQFPSFAGPPQFFREDMTIERLVEMGVPQSILSIEYFSVHGYPYNICSDSDAAQVDLRNFLDHSKTRSLIDQYSAEVEAAKSLGKPVHMGETGSVACHGKDGVSNTLGAALWNLDYSLTGASFGIDRFFFHMGQGDFYYSMWEPIGTEANPGAHINPTYYSMLFMADLVSDLQAPKVASFESLDTSSAVHFAIYEDTEIRKLVLINTQYFTESSSRPSLDFNVEDILGSNVKVQRLTGGSSAAQNGVTWAGQSVNSEGIVEGERSVEYISNGIVTLLGSEAAIVEISGY